MREYEKYFRYLIASSIFGSRRTKEILSGNPITLENRKDAEQVFITIHDYDAEGLRALLLN